MKCGEMMTLITDKKTRNAVRNPTSFTGILHDN